jgi:hypothetical protein
VGNKETLLKPPVKVVMKPITEEKLDVLISEVLRESFSNQDCNIENMAPRQKKQKESCCVEEKFSCWSSHESF